MRALVFQLAGPMMAFGDVAVGEHRGVFDRPSKSGVLGLVAAALGINRGDDAAHAALANGLDFATATIASGRLIHDYHTAQSASEAALNRRRKAGRVTATRADELDVGSRETTLSRRSYRVGATHLVALVQRESSDIQLDQVAEALQRPVYVLYLGRKSCPPSLPLAPRVVEADDIAQAFRGWRAAMTEAQTHLMSDFNDVALQELTADPALVPAEAINRTLRSRRDQPGSRRRRQFSTRSDVWFDEAPQ